MRSVRAKRPDCGDLFIGFIRIFAMPLAIMIMGPLRPWSDRYLFWPFDCFQRIGSTNDV
jgi:hypothetical protein